MNMNSTFPQVIGQDISGYHSALSLSREEAPSALQTRASIWIKNYDSIFRNFKQLRVTAGV